MLTEDDTQFGRFQLVECIAIGGMAKLYRAVLPGPSGFSKTFVIKRILPELNHDERFRAMFLHEGRIMAALSHPNLVQVYELGETEGRLFLCLEYVPGCDLSTVVRARAAHGGPLEAPVVAWIGREICRGLDYVHNFSDASGRCLSIVHRDVSPHNVLLSEHGDVKVADFGVAKSTARRTLTEVHKIHGKLEYLAPEQARGDVVGPATDVYAVGLVLYELLTLERYLRGAGLGEKFRGAAEPQWRPITEINPAVPAPLERVVQRALRPEVELRFPTAQALGDSLAQALGTVSASSCRTELAGLVSATRAAVEAEPRQRGGGLARPADPGEASATVLDAWPSGLRGHRASTPTSRARGERFAAGRRPAARAASRPRLVVSGLRIVRGRGAGLLGLGAILAVLALAVAGRWAPWAADDGSATGLMPAQGSRSRGGRDRLPRGNAAKKAGRQHARRDGWRRGTRRTGAGHPKGALGGLRQRARQRGIRYGDVPEVDALFLRASLLLARDSPAEANAAVRELGEAIERVVIDRRLVEHKLLRLRQSVPRAELGPRHAERLRQAAELVAQGRLLEANETMNAVLDAAEQPR